MYMVLAKRRCTVPDSHWHSEDLTQVLLEYTNPLLSAQVECFNPVLSFTVTLTNVAQYHGQKDLRNQISLNSAPHRS